MYLVHGEYGDLLARLFAPTDDGRITFGWATSAGQVPEAASLAEWTLFRDYIMEGFVFYSIRARAVPTGLALEVRLTGSNRDQYVGPTVRQYLKWAGLVADSLESSSET